MASVSRVPTSMASKKLDVSRRSQSSSRPSRSSAATSRDRTRTPSKEAVTGISPTKVDKKLPPIKAPVGLVRGPDLKNIQSKIGSLENVKHKPAGGEKKALTQKLEWTAKSRIGSLQNASHKAGGGKVKVESQKLDFKSNVSSKVGSLDYINHKPGGGQIKIFDEKYASGSRSSECRSPNQVRSPSPTESQVRIGSGAKEPVAAVEPEKNKENGTPRPTVLNVQPETLRI
ncbi:Microtubule-associated protein 2 [Halotydeus destructor]|nr:Microtubule-associated protein 2 [Halotydeus destructor]